MVLDLFQVALSLIACAFYVVETYIDMENVGWWKAVEMAFTLNFLVDYIFRFYVAKDKMVYYFSPMALVDFITVVPPLVWAVLVISGTTQLQFLRVLRLLRALRVLRVLKIMRMFSSNLYADLSVTRMAIKVGFTCFCLIFSTIPRHERVSRERAKRHSPFGTNAFWTSFRSAPTTRKKSL